MVEPPGGAGVAVGAGVVVGALVGTTEPLGVGVEMTGEAVAVGAVDGARVGATDGVAELATGGDDDRGGETAEASATVTVVLAIA